MRHVRVKHIESGKEFNTIAEAAEFFHIDRKYVSGRRAYRPGLTFERIEVSPSNELNILHTDDPEEFKPIPGYEGLYSISNKGRIRSDKFPGRMKKYTTSKAGQHLIALSKNSQQSHYTVESLYNLTWNNIPIPHKTISDKRKQTVQCIDENKTFGSIKECTKYYRIDYSKFVKIRKRANNNTFVIKGHTFK